jgi:hypothetical protein
MRTLSRFCPGLFGAKMSFQPELILDATWPAHEDAAAQRLHVAFPLRPRQSEGKQHDPRIGKSR